jgi:hypothetical protein
MINFLSVIVHRGEKFYSVDSWIRCKAKRLKFEFTSKFYLFSILEASLLPFLVVAIDPVGRNCFQKDYGITV